MDHNTTEPLCYSCIRNRRKSSSCSLARNKNQGICVEDSPYLPHETLSFEKILLSFTQVSSYLHDGRGNFRKRNQVQSHPTTGCDVPTFWLFQFGQGKNDCCLGSRDQATQPVRFRNHLIEILLYKTPDYI